MGITSLQVCMDTSDWLQGVTTHEEVGMDSSSSPSGDIIACSRPLLERRMRPQQDQALKCPRCDSTHTKFCYYNNYSLSQPRYFCKTCRRYWTKGGSLRNIPVGGGCRKNKKVTVTKKSSVDNSQKPNHHPTTTSSSSSSQDATALHLSFPELQISQLNTFWGHPVGNLGNPLLMESKYNALLDQNPPRPSMDFMESKFDAILGNPRNHDFMGTTDLGLLGGGLGDVGHGFTPTNLHGICSPYENGICLDGSNASLVDTCQRLMLPYEASHEDPNAVEMKPNKQLLSLEWQDQGCSEVGKDSFGYLNNLGSWSTGIMNGYGSSPANPLV